MWLVILAKLDDAFVNYFWFSFGGGGGERDRHLVTAQWASFYAGGESSHEMSEEQPGTPARLGLGYEQCSRLCASGEHYANAHRYRL